MTAPWQKWPRWARRVAFGVITTLAGAIALDMYARLKSVVARIATGTTVADLIAEGVSLSVTPTVRSSGFHGFLWLFGHWDYLLAFRCFSCPA